MNKLYLNRFERRIYSLPRLTTVRIVCGDCDLAEATEDASAATILPRQTFMNIHGTCGTCGGRSFVMAAEIAPTLARTIKGQRAPGAETTAGLQPAVESKPAQSGALIN